MISVIIPTVTGREHWLERCLAAYDQSLNGWPTGPIANEVIVIKDRPSCGIAWNEGIERAKANNQHVDADRHYIHLTADDIEPSKGCMWPFAMYYVRDWKLPAARILNTDGTLQSCGTDHLEHDDGEEAFVARIPFATREQFDRIGPMMNEHYMTDYWFSHRGRECGYPSVVLRSYCFFHHYAQEGRIDTLDADVRAYKRRGGT